MICQMLTSSDLGVTMYTKKPPATNEGFGGPNQFVGLLLHLNQERRRRTGRHRLLVGHVLPAPCHSARTASAAVR